MSHDNLKIEGNRFMKDLKNQSGFSLIELMIATAIIGVITMAFLTITSRNQRDMKGLFQKSEILEFKNLLLQRLGDPQICTWQIRDQVIDVSATTSTNPSPTQLQLQQLYVGLNTSSPLLASRGQRLPASNSNLNIRNMVFKNILSTGRAGEFQGTLEVEFDPDTLALPQKPLQVQQFIQVRPEDPSSAKRISQCGNRDSPLTYCLSGQAVLSNAPGCFQSVAVNNSDFGANPTCYSIINAMGYSVPQDITSVVSQPSLHTATHQIPVPGTRRFDTGNRWTVELWVGVRCDNGLLVADHCGCYLTYSPESDDGGGDSGGDGT